MYIFVFNVFKYFKLKYLFGKFSFQFLLNYNNDQYSYKVDMQYVMQSIWYNEQLTF